MPTQYDDFLEFINNTEDDDIDLFEEDEMLEENNWDDENPPNDEEILPWEDEVQQIDIVTEETEVDETKTSESENIQDSKEDVTTPTPVKNKRGRGRPPKNKNSEESKTESKESETEKESEDKSEDKSPWVKELRDHTKTGLQLKDGTHTYYYKPITDPENIETGYFSCHCNIKDRTIPKSQQLEWHTKKMCLSKVYKPVVLSELIKELKNHIKYDNSTFNDNSPFLLTWRANIIDEEERHFENTGDKQLFDAITGLKSDDEFGNISENLDLCIVNSYDGTSTMKFNIVLSFKDDTNNSFSDFFTLYNKKFRFHHKGGFGDLIKENLKDLNNIFDTNTKALKNYDERKNVEKAYKELHLKFTREYKKDFSQLWDSIDDGYKNLYYLYLCASSVLSNKYSSFSHMNILPIVEKYTNLALQKQELKDKNNNI